MCRKGSTGYNRIVIKPGFKSLLLSVLALVGAALPALPAGAGELEDVFDGSIRPARPLQPTYATALEAQVAAMANGAQGRIGVAAIDLASGRTISVLGNQPFPLASTSKIAIAATFLDGVDQGRFRLSDQFPLMLPVPSAKFSSTEAPVRPGAMLSAERLIELSLTRSDNHATDALLAAIGGPAAVNRWFARTGLTGFHIDRTIATLVRDDGAVNPAFSVDPRDSVAPLTMARLLTGLYQGQWLTPASRSVLLGAMSRCVTGKNRLRAMLPADARIAHKTGTLNNTSSDVGIIETPDGRAMAVAVYVTGQGGKPGREQRIASIARVIYDGYRTDVYGQRITAAR